MGIGLVLVAFGIFSLIRPPVFRASATIRLEESDDSFSNSLRTIHFCFGLTEIENIQSDTILSNVVFRLNLDSNSGKKPSTPRSVAILRSQLDVRPRPNTKLVDIRVANEDAMEAAEIANTVAKVYRDWRQEKIRRLVAGGSGELMKQLKLQEERTRMAGDRLEGLRKSLALPSPEPDDEFLRSNFPEYLETKKNLSDEQAIENLLTRKLKIEQDDLQLPYHTPETILEFAIPAIAPSRHLQQFGAILLLVGLAISGCGLAITRNSKTSDLFEST